MTAFDAAGGELAGETYYSVGGGFVVSEAEAEAGHAGGNEPAGPVPHEFGSAAELLAIGRRTGLSIADIVRRERDGLAAARRDRRRAGPHLGRHGAVHRARLPRRGRPARRAERADGGPACCSATSQARPRRPTRWPCSTG